MPLARYGRAIGWRSDRRRSTLLLRLPLAAGETELMATERLMCCVCGGDPSNGKVPTAEYVELLVTFPEAEDSIRQWLGVHRECLVQALGQRVEMAP